MIKEQLIKMLELDFQIADVQEKQQILIENLLKKRKDAEETFKNQILADHSITSGSDKSPTNFIVVGNQTFLVEIDYKNGKEKIVFSLIEEIL